MNIGSKILKIRKDNKMSQEDFAEIFNVSRQTISSWENSKSYPDIETLTKMSDKFNISLDILLKEDKEMIKELDRKIKGVKKYKLILAMIILFIVGFISYYLICDKIYFMQDYNKDAMYVDEKFSYGNLRMSYKNICASYAGAKHEHKITTLSENEQIKTIIFVNTKCNIFSKQLEGKNKQISISYDNIVNADLIKDNKYQVYYYKGNLDDITSYNPSILKAIEKSHLVYEN